MQRLASPPWVLHRLSRKSLQSSQPSSTPRARSGEWDCQNRYVGTKYVWPKVNKIPMRNTFPLFELSRLVLDLDAEDNKHVRSFNEGIDGVPDKNPKAGKKRDAAAIRRRIARFEKEYEIDQSNYQITASNQFSPWRIADLDIFSMALRGAPSVSKSESTPNRYEPPVSMVDLSDSEIARALLSWNGIPQNALNDSSRIISNMLRRQQLTSRKTRLPGNMQPLVEAIGQSRSLAEFKRLIMHLLQTPEGRTLASQCSGVIAQMGHQTGQHTASETLSDVLCLLNDIYINLRAHGLPVDGSFARTGLLLAVSCEAFPAVRMYLAHGFARHRGANSPQFSQCEFDADLSACLSRFLWSITRSKQKGETPGVSVSLEERRVSVYGLLTGQYVHSQDDGYSFFRGALPFTLHKCVGDAIPLSHSYIRILAELGAVRTLWHEFHGEKVNSFFQAKIGSYKKLSLRDNGLAKTQPSAVGKFIAAAFLQTLDNVESGQMSIPVSSIMSATGEYANDCKLDLTTIALSSRNVAEERSSGISVSSNLLNPHTGDDSVQPTHLLEVPAKDIDRHREIVEAFRLPDITESMSALRAIMCSRVPST